MDYVIIGNGVAGVSAAQFLSSKLDSNSTITQFTDEFIPGYYNRPRIPGFLANKEISVNDIIAYDFDWYNRRKIDLHINERVEKINVEAHLIKTTNHSYSYDQMLIATGATCLIPPIDGQHLNHFYTIRNLSDAIKIRNRFKSGKKAVIIGGGVLGLEAANAAVSQGLKTTVIEYFPYLLPRQLDEEGGKILQKILESRGINILVGKSVQSILGSEEVERVLINDGSEIPTNIVLVCTGIKPRIDLVKDILKINKGIIVNEYLETSISNIYAAGDCAEFQGRIYGLIPPSIEQAKIAAANMIDPRSEEYYGSKISSTLKVTDLFLSSFGYKGNENELGYESIKFVSKEQYVKIYVHEDKIKAAIVLGVRKLLPIIKNIFNKELSLSENLSKIQEITQDIIEEK
ncbi:MAG: NAD(P)/FAD-dependent oxidoreductase [Candidatus Hodarchaeota archaeon]